MTAVNWVNATAATMNPVWYTLTEIYNQQLVQSSQKTSVLPQDSCHLVQVQAIYINDNNTSHRVSRGLEPPRSGISAGAGQTNNSHHWRH